MRARTRLLPSEYGTYTTVNSGLGFQVTVLKIVQVVPSVLGSDRGEYSQKHARQVHLFDQFVPDDILQ